MTYFKKRYIGFIATTIISLAIPFITIDGNHLILLNFVQTEFHFMGKIFSVQELHLMPFLVMLLFIGLFALTSLAGRFWCGWICPQTILRFIFRDVIQTYILKLRKNIDNKQKEPDMSLWENKTKYILSVIIFSSLAFIVSINFMLYFVPYDYFFMHILDIQEHSVLIFFTLLIAFIIITMVVMLKENFCIYACPYAKVQSVLYDRHTFTAVYSHIRGGEVYKDGQKVVSYSKDLEPSDECILCNKCVKVCPTHIDIRKGLQIECIECLACVDACTVVMGKKDKSSLIQWESEAQSNQKIKTPLLRAKSISYAVALMIILVLLALNSNKNSDLELNINRSSQLYSVQESVIQNAYILLLHNKTKTSHKYYIKTSHPDITVARPSKPFTIKPKAKNKVILALSLKKSKLKEQIHKNGVIKLKIQAYAIDNNEINITKDSFFVIPKQ